MHILYILAVVIKCTKNTSYNLNTQANTNVINNAKFNIFIKFYRYNTMWYLAPISIQKLLLFVMQNSLKTHTLTLGHIYVTSLEGFSTVINTL